jgi:predicted PurR-regulated permease PerM
MNINNSSVPAKILVYSTVAVILTIGMREISAILTTILFSIFAALLFTPLVRWLKRKGIPGGLSVILVISLFVIIVAILGLMVAEAAIQFGKQIPIYQLNLIGFIDALTRYIPSQYLSLEGKFSLNSILRGIATVVISVMKSAINGLVNAGTTAGIIILTAAFLLIDASNAPEKIESELENQSELQRRMSKFSKNLVGFIVIRAETNLITAVGITIVFLIAGIEFAILWGVLIFLLSYIPYIGLVIAAIPPTMLALFNYGPIGALVILIVIFGFDAIAENVIFPSLAGKGLRLSPAFLFIALIYWNYVLGTAGVLLSIPLTIVVKIILESFEETKWMARLMGPADDIEDYKKGREQGE